MASFVAGRRYLGTNHSRGVAVDLVGTGTAWTQGGTTFALSGPPAAGSGIATKIVNSNTNARIVIISGPNAGTLTISDGTSTATIQVKPLHRTRWFPGLTRR